MVDETLNHTNASTRAKISNLRDNFKGGIRKHEAESKAKQHAKGKLTARERIDMVLDQGSFFEIDEFVVHGATGFSLEDSNVLGDSVVAGTGTVNGRPVAIFSQDFTVFGGSLGAAAGDKILKIMKLAINSRIPLVGILDSGGARIQEGVAALGKYGEIFRLNTAASGLIPQLSIVCGPAAGGAVYSPALTDFVIMVDKSSQMFVTGPEVIKAVTGEDVSMEDLGGAKAHNSISGVSHYLAEDEEDAFDFARCLLSYLPSCSQSEAPRFEYSAETEVTSRDVELDTVIPDSSSTPYDMSFVIERLLDRNSFIEIQALFAPNIIVGFGRVDGFSVGIIANQPTNMAGTLNIDAGEKAARFVRLCDAFSVPIVTLVDVPGYLPGVDQEWSGVIRRGAKLLYAYAEATVPMVTIITRKAYGGAYIVMGSKQIGADLAFAWPTAEIAVMGGEAAVNILYRKQLTLLKEKGGDLDTERARLVEQYVYNTSSPYLAAGRGEIDGVIEPSTTRLILAKSLRALRGKKVSDVDKKHGNIPL